MCVLCRFGEPEIQRTQEDVQEAVLKSIILEMLYTIIFRYYSNISTLEFNYEVRQFLNH